MGTPLRAGATFAGGAVRSRAGEFGGDKPPRSRILVVDDENGPRQALRMLLNEDHEVRLASSVREALKALDAGPFQLIITDVRMPERSGVDLLRAVKEAYPGIEVIILTGYGQLETAMKAVEYGAFAYLEKPFDNDAMLKQVDAALRRFYYERNRRALEELALEANRFETLGRVVSGLIHDLGTPLSVIGSQVELLCMRPSAEGAGKRLETMRSQIGLCTEIVRRTMNFLRERPDTFAQLSLNDVVTSCLAVGRPLLRGQRVAVSEDLDPHMPPVLGDFVLVRQAVLNLVTNACYAMAEQKKPQKIVIRTWHDESTASLSVKDTGPGIAQVERNKIFDTFYSTKAEQGTGLGLAVVQNVMRRHRGVVQLADTTGRGAEFILSFPVATRRKGY
ncbi:MAG TPA: hybrid sensor histidine kinase/response regulator [Candidatus Hydrogenedentes bacterium]|nr:hybrid sensor histidine kinase/response regulator [Candidatus Hydrogenedentota bacterium]